MNEEKEIQILDENLEEDEDINEVLRNKVMVYFEESAITGDIEFRSETELTGLIIGEALEFDSIANEEDKHYFINLKTAEGTYLLDITCMEYMLFFWSQVYKDEKAARLKQNKSIEVKVRLVCGVVDKVTWLES